MTDASTTPYAGASSPSLTAPRLGTLPWRRLVLPVTGVLAAAALAVPAARTLAGDASPAEPLAPAAPAEQATPGLAFALPSLGELRRSPRKAFAHYLPSLPVSLDNKPSDVDYYARQYLTPDGEGRRHRAYGGFLRDRPLPRDVRTGQDWRSQDLQEEVRQAISVGLDGFAVDLLTAPGGTGGSARVSGAVELMLDAAQAVDPQFEILLMPDMVGSLKRLSPEALAAYVARLGAHPSAYRLADGRLVVAPFHTETHPASWWARFLEEMSTTQSTPVAFLPVFLDEREHVEAFAPFSYGLGSWGSRNPDDNDPTARGSASPRGRVDAVRSRGLTWMHPVSVQDERPRSGTYQEARGTETLRRTWEVAISSGAELVQVATWNDYAEGSHVAPSPQQGYGFLDVSAYYLTWWKTGQRPTLLRDTLHLTHRTHAVAARPTGPQTRLMQLRGSTAPRDEVEALAFLTAPATVVVRVGQAETRCALPAGVAVCRAPLQVGAVSATLERDGLTTVQVQSPRSVVARPTVQDLHYGTTSSDPALGRTLRRTTQDLQDGVDLLQP